MKNKPLKVLLPILVLIIVLGALFTFRANRQAYESGTNAMKMNLLGGNSSCSLPCWENITPGMTTRSEAIDKLKEIPIIQRSSMQELGALESGGVSWAWIRRRERIDPRLSWKNGIVDNITLGLSVDLTVQEFIDKYGTPQAVDIADGGVPEHWYWIIHLFYPEIGTQVVAYTSEFSNMIEPTTKIVGVILFPPSTLEDQVAVFYRGIDPSYRNFYENWKGFGDLVQLYDIK